MPILPIRIYGDPILREEAAPVESITDDLRSLADDMALTMYDARGIGLAGNQVGVLQRILVIDVSEADEPREKGEKRPSATERSPETYLNAEILDSSPEDGEYNEGCLSIPGVEGEVWRPLRIRVRWTDLDGAEHDEWVDGMRARVLQHEIDHLDGVLFIDHLPLARKTAVLGRLNRLKRETLAGETA